MGPEIKVPFVSLYTKETAVLSDSIFKEIRNLVEQSQFILSEKVTQFEARFSELSGCYYAVGVNSGLDALVLGMRSLGLGPGDEVITPPNSFLGSTAAITLVGARPVFVDVREDFNIDPDLIERAVTKKTKAVMLVHLTGNPCQMDKILEVCQHYNLKLIEDAAQSVGARFKGKLVGSFGDVGCFSLHPLKNLHVWGDGGVITTNLKQLAENLKLQRNHGLINRDESDFFSYNSRLDSIQAVVGLAFAELLKSVTEKRTINARIYEERLGGLGEDLSLPIIDRENAEHVFHVYQLRVKNRDALKEFLLKKGIETKTHYPIPIHLQKAAQYLGYKKGDFPVTEKLATEILSIPVRENLTKEECYYISDQIHLFYKK